MSLGTLKKEERKTPPTKESRKYKKIFEGVIFYILANSPKLAKNKRVAKLPFKKEKFFVNKEKSNKIFEV